MIRNILVIASTVVCVALVGCASKDAGKKSDTSATAAAKKAKKGGGAKGSAAAKSAGQKTGSTATENKSKAEDKGATLEDATCDAELEGTAWCGSDTHAIFCAEGHWYELDCAQVGGDVCAETTDAHVVDCDAVDEVE
jgi:hypothetical protein